jgi:hypothetical protein
LRAPITIRNSVISGNNALEGGGGVYVSQQSDDPLLIANTEVSGNSVFGDAYPYSGGGGISIRQIGGASVTVQGSKINDNSIDEMSGGGIAAVLGFGGKVEIAESTISGNSASGTLGFGTTGVEGGGVYVYFYQANGELRINDSTIAGNSSEGDGGGVFVCNKSDGFSVNNDASIVNSTLSANTSGNLGGGVAFLGENVNGSVEINSWLTNVTVTDNSADDGAGLYIQSGPNLIELELRNSIISENEDLGGNINNILGTAKATSASNLVGSGGSGGLVNGQNNNQVGVAFNNPGLGPLADNGGPTFTHALLPSSAAIDMGDDSLAVDLITMAQLAFDQRSTGFSRFVDGDGDALAIVDIGAYELGDTVAPQVLSVSIGSTVSLHPNYVIPAGGDQLRTVPVGRPDQLIVEFSEPVSASTADLELTGLRSSNVYGVSSVTVVGSTVTWTFSGLGTEADQIAFAIKDLVEDAAGNRLDGEWLDPQSLGDTGGSQFPSGDGSELGDFVFTATFMPGDFNRDNIVNGQDFVIWNGNKFTTNSNFTAGDGNGDGVVDGPDFVLWNQSKFDDWTQLPSQRRAVNTRDDDIDLLRRRIDMLIDRSGVIQDGAANPKISEGRWVAFADALEHVMRDYDAVGENALL